MNFLQLVQYAMKRAGVREDVPTTLDNATGIVDDFKDYVRDTYRRIQTTAHKERWFFRQMPDQIITMVIGQDNYTVPAGLAQINWDTVTVYTVAKTDETPVQYIDYYKWRKDFDTRSIESNRPQWITATPAGILQVFPVPDQAYSLRFDGVRSVHDLAGNTDEPIIPEDYQWTLIWGAVKRWAKHNEDGAKLADAQDEYRPVYDSLVNVGLPDSRVVSGHLYGARRRISP